MASTILVTARPAPQRVIVNVTGSRSGDGGQVPRRGTCKGVRAGSGGRERRRTARGDEDQTASGDRGDGHGRRPRPRVMAGGRGGP
jgi:hypothetical protein